MCFHLLYLQKLLKRRSDIKVKRQTSFLVDHDKKNGDLRAVYGQQRSHGQKLSMAKALKYSTFAYVLFSTSPPSFHFQHLQS